MFDHVIEYLRTLRYSDAELAMPVGRSDLVLLVREADFYGLPELSAKVRPKPSNFPNSPPEAP